ncbi:chitobiase/beta-hexosaminidase C-terminal domain-containing protein [Myxococcus sp. CA056]|uniref:chitobiase/beta-hexosaminidase C-terminal domain-containing protein n=1 Tax=Myxococcus sp. CA056 TaxID=2741740 RepID=UPI00157B4E74|nr:chitobiase/beta-hexosaminidase C-terminal domain-containing protein [Myxococcus sp. CA056]NTX16273.1 chitobiase/beta-hexosaminidase C-terminal domain-containing protein [Myxococcus sp. CA056]
MSRTVLFLIRPLSALLCLGVLTSACGDAGSGPGPTPPGSTDTVAPTTVASPAGGLFNSPRTVTLTCDDGTGSGCEATYYTLDGSAPTTRSIRYSAFVMVEASATLRFFSVDHSGNSESARSAEFVVDVDPPVVSASPGSGTHDAPLIVTLTCDDGTGSGCSRIHYTLDGAVPSETSPLYSAPLTLIAGARLRFIAMDRAGNASREGTELYSFDKGGPASAATPRGGVFAGPTQVALTCDDSGGSGCASTRYTLDGTAPTLDSPVYAGPLQLTTTTTVRFFSMDTEGNRGDLVIETYVIDTAPPTASATPRGGTYSSAQSVTLSCEDTGGAGCVALHFTTDGTSPTTVSARYGQPLALSSSTTLRFLAVDGAGNLGPVVSEAYVIDTVPPTASATPRGGSYSSARSVTLSCDDTGGSGCSALHFTTDGTSPTTASARYGQPLALSSSTTLRFLAVDSAGNLGPVVSEAYVIDTVPPTASATPRGGTYSSAQSVTLSCEDTGGSGCSALHFTTDGSSPTTASARYVQPLALSSSTTLRFLAVDGAGNLGATVSEAYVIDTVPPTASATPRGGTYSSAQSVTLSCDDTGGSGCSALHFTTDGTSPTTASARYAQPLALSSSTTLRFLAVDGAGNLGATVTETYSIMLAPTTVAQPEGGLFRTPQTVTLVCTDGAGLACAGTWYTLDDSEPTPTTGTPYTGPISLSSTTRLRFVSRDSVGTLEASRLQVYTFDVTAPLTQAEPPGGTFNGPVTVRLTCTDAPAGCRETRYTLDGTAVSSSSPLYTAPIVLGRNTTVNFKSVDNVGNEEPGRQEIYTLPDVANNASSQIDWLRGAADGAQPMLPINGAIVTFVKPGVGDPTSDGPGIFLQAKQEGPAIFVSVNPAGLVPPPVAGDWVSVRVNHLRTVNGLRRASIDTSSYAVLAKNFPVATLAQEVSSVDLPLVRDMFDSELISLQGVINGAFTPSGTGHLQAPLTTSAIPVGSSSAAQFRLRMVATVNDTVELTPGCTVSLTSPLWHYVSASASTQPSLWVPEQLTSQTCPSPAVIETKALSATSVLVRFDRRLDAGSLLGSGAQFSITALGGLAVTGATLQSPTEVVLTTAPQTPRQGYDLKVASTLRDRRGVGVQAPTNSGFFQGFSISARLRITEVAPNMTGGRDLVELRVLQSGSVGGMTLLLDGGPAPLATFPEVEVQAGDVIVMHLNPDLVQEDAGPQSETLGRTEFPQAAFPANHDSAWDFHSGATVSLPTGNRVLRVRDAQGAVQDGLAVTVQSNTSAGFLGELQTLQGQGQWSPTNCGGVPCTYSTLPTAWSVSVSWSSAFVSTGKQITLGRVTSVDSNSASDWAVGTGTFGLVNP